MPDSTPLSEADLDVELANLPGWIIRDGWLRRTYTTPGWTHTQMLAQTIAFIAEAAWHHPDLALGYAEVTVKLQTHRVQAITAMDLALAKRIDEVALWEPEGSSPLQGFPKRWVH